MRYKFLVLSALLTACGAIDAEIEKANATTSGTNTATATDQNVKTGSRTVSTSTTTTISQSGDQSVFTDTSTKTAMADKPWADEQCEDGISYRKQVGPDGILTVVTYVFDNSACDGKPQVFVQRRKSEN